MQRKTLHKQYKKLGISAVRRIGFSFFAVILIGSILLSLPMSHSVHSTSSYLDHLFVATSATCVTGLVTHVTASEYTLFGQIVIILLIQIGGLGFLTLMSMFFVLLKRKLTYANKIVMQEALNRNSLNETGIYIKRVIKYTVCFELIGAICLAFVFIPQFGILKGIYYSLFHAISAFCNAGFDILGNNSMVPYVGNVWINLVICGLIIAGGLGFVVWIDLRLSLIHYREHFKYFKIKRYLESLSLHTKIALISTFVLIFGGMTVIFILEFQNPLTLKSLPFSQKILASFFQSVTLRTAGFATVDMASLHQATKFFMSIIMFIGGSPSGTAGGVKTVTVAMIILTAYAIVKNKRDTEVFGRSISEQNVRKGIAVFVISFAVLLLSMGALSIVERADFLDTLYECVSALATVGLSRGITAQLGTVGKIIIIVTMYIGRIGPISLALFFNANMTQKDVKHYPVADIQVG